MNGTRQARKNLNVPDDTVLDISLEFTLIRRSPCPEGIVRADQGIFALSRDQIPVTWARILNDRIHPVYSRRGSLLQGDVSGVQAIPEVRRSITAARAIAWASVNGAGARCRDVFRPPLRENVKPDVERFGPEPRPFLSGHQPHDDRHSPHTIDIFAVDERGRAPLYFDTPIAPIKHVSIVMCA